MLIGGRLRERTHKTVCANGCLTFSERWYLNLFQFSVSKSFVNVLFAKWKTSHTVYAQPICMWKIMFCKVWLFQTKWQFLNKSKFLSLSLCSLCVNVYLGLPISALSLLLLRRLPSFYCVFFLFLFLFFFFFFFFGTLRLIFLYFSNKNTNL